MQVLDVAECPIDPSVLLFCFSGRQNSNLWQIHQNQHMNHKPQSLSVLPWLAVVAGVLTLVTTCALRIPAAFADEAQPPVEAAAPATAAVQEPAATEPQSSVAQSGDELLTQVRAKLEGLDSLKCELHQTAVISGMKLTSFGRYTEAAGNRVHLQYHIFPLIQAKADDVKALALDAEAPTINEADNRVKYVMNGFVISVGSYVKPMLSKAKATAKRIGAVDVNVGDTACKVPLATEYIAKVEQANRIGQKRKTAKC